MVSASDGLGTILGCLAALRLSCEAGSEAWKLRLVVISFTIGIHHDPDWKL